MDTTADCETPPSQQHQQQQQQQQQQVQREDVIREIALTTDVCVNPRTLPGVVSYLCWSASQQVNVTIQLLPVTYGVDYCIWTRGVAPLMLTVDVAPLSPAFAQRCPPAKLGLTLPQLCASPGLAFACCQFASVARVADDPTRLVFCLARTKGGPLSWPLHYGVDVNDPDAFATALAALPVTRVRQARLVLVPAASQDEPQHE